MASFQVVLADLQSLADTFHQQSEAVARLRPDLSPPPPDGGDATLDDVLATVLTAFGVADDGVSRVVEEHAAKLQATHDGYSAHDSDVRRLFEAIMEGS